MQKMKRQRAWRIVGPGSALVLALVTCSCSLNRNAGESATIGRVDETLFQAAALTADGLFTKGIEGPACDREGNIYAVNFAREQTIGKVTPNGKGADFLELPGKSTGNGIVFDPAGTMFVADYVGHNVLRIDSKTRQISVLAHDDRMNQPK